MGFVLWRQFTLSVTESTEWLHTVQVGLGLIILFLSIMVLFNPIFGTVPVVLFLALVLLFAGIEKVIIGFTPSGKSHLISIGLGIIVIVVALIAMTFHTGTSIFIVMLFGIALLIDGISRTVYTFRDNQIKGKSKSFGIGVGMLSTIFALVIMTYPRIGLVVAGIFIGISLFVTSVQIISDGMAWRQRRKYAALE
jgi:uncharacterized membrane protein HdeD (DUF308 family)